MAFLIPDNLKSRADVPAVMQRVARAFQMSLDDDVIVWYEPLYDLAEVRPHLVVLLPNQGIAVLEVLDVRAERLLGIFRGKLKFERDGQVVEAPSPLVRAERLAETLRQRVAAEPRLARVAVPVAAGAVLAGLAEEEARAQKVQRVIALERCLFKPDLDAALQGEGESRLLRAFARTLGGAASPLTHHHVALLRGVIQPEIAIDRIAGVQPATTSSSRPVAKQLEFAIFRPPSGADDIVRVMDQRQEALAKSIGDGHRVIRGVAGSGKTLVLVYRAKLLAQRFPQRQILVTCYTRSLASELRRMLAGFPNITVAHLDALMASALRDAGISHPGYDVHPDGERLAGLALQALSRGASSRYHAVFIDEAQDFGTNRLRFTAGLLASDSTDLFVVADAAQNIFRRRFSWKQAGIQAQGRTRILRINYRNTREILEFASRFLLAGTSLHPDEAPDINDEHAIIPPESAERSGPRPEVEVLPDARVEVQRTVERVRAWLADGARTRRIAVLYAASTENGFNRAQALHRALRTAGVNVFWVNEPGNRTAKDRVGEADAPVILSTIHSAKGLEFPCVALCGLWQERDDVESNRKLAYVGMTRATDVLAVFTSRTNPLVADLQDACRSRDVVSAGNDSESAMFWSLHVIWIVDSSRSMADSGKIQALNTTIKEAAANLRWLAAEHPRTRVLMRAVAFATGARWHIERPTPIDQVSWPDLAASGQRDTGQALRLVTEQLGALPDDAPLLPPVLILVTDGAASDDFDAGLDALMSQPWGKRAVRIGVAIGATADREALRRFIARRDAQPLEARDINAIVSQVQFSSPWIDFLSGASQFADQDF